MRYFGLLHIVWRSRPLPHNGPAVKTGREWGRGEPFKHYIKVRAFRAMAIITPYFLDGGDTGYSDACVCLPCQMLPRAGGAMNCRCDISRVPVPVWCKYCYLPDLVFSGEQGQGRGEHDEVEEGMASWCEPVACFADSYLADHQCWARQRKYVLIQMSR